MVNVPVTDRHWTVISTGPRNDVPVPVSCLSMLNDPRAAVYVLTSRATVNPSAGMVACCRSGGSATASTAAVEPLDTSVMVHVVPATRPRSSRGRSRAPAGKTPGDYYERLGYRTVGVIEDCPTGTNTRWYCKDLQGSDP